MDCDRAEFKLARVRQQQQVVARNHVRQLRRTNSSQLQTIINMHAQNRSLLEISRHLKMAPCIVARTFLELVENMDKSKIYKRLLSTLELYDISSNSRLQNELKECVEEDVHCSPLCDRLRRSEGDEYEHLMVHRLIQLGIPFENEHMLRERGLAKTPDALLLVPIQVKVLDTWHIVQWIDSKAMAHEIGTENESQHIAQAHAYVNRFGPGMLVYWKGIDSHVSNEEDIVVVDQLPSEFLFPGQKQIKQIDSFHITSDEVFIMEPMQVKTIRNEQGIPCSIVSF